MSLSLGYLLTFIILTNHFASSNDSLELKNTPDNDAQVKNMIENLERKSDLDALRIDSRWQIYLLTPPSLIAVLGALVSIGSVNGFELENFDKVNGTNYNDSRYFSVRTQALSDEMYICFENATDKINHIRVVSRSTTAFILKFVNLLAKGSRDLILLHAKDYLRMIGSNVKTISGFANTIESRFLSVMNSIGRLGEQLTSTDSMAQLAVSESKEAIDGLKIQKLQYDKMMTIAKQQLEKTEKELSESRAKYFNAVKDKPLRGNFYEIAKKISKIKLSDVILPLYIMKKIKESSDGTTEDVEKKTEEYLLNVAVLRRADELEDAIRELSKTIKTLNETSNATRLANAVIDIYCIHEFIKTGYEASKLDGTQFMKDLLPIYSDVVSLTEELSNNVTSNSTLESEYLSKMDRSLLEQLNGLKKLYKIAKETYKVEYEKQQKNSNSDEDGEDTKIRHLKTIYDQHKKRDEEQFQNVLKNTRKLDDLMIKILKLNITKMKNEQIHMVVKEAVVLMVDIQSFWSLLVEMTQQLTMIMDTKMKPTYETMKKFANLQISDSKENEGETATNYYAEELRETASYLSSYSAFLQFTAETYCNVSNEYYLPPLRTMISLTTHPTEQGRLDALTNLQKATSESHTGIENFINYKQQEFQAHLSRQNETIEKIFGYITSNNPDSNFDI